MSCGWHECFRIPPSRVEPIVLSSVTLTPHYSISMRHFGRYRYEVGTSVTEEARHARKARESRPLLPCIFMICRSCCGWCRPLLPAPPLVPRCPPPRVQLARQQYFATVCRRNEHLLVEALGIDRHQLAGGTSARSSPAYSRGTGRKPGASSHTRKRPPLSLSCPVAGVCGGGAPRSPPTGVHQLHQRWRAAPHPAVAAQVDFESNF
jgi:hypothetical protein